jgi:hypothetical protein
MNNLRDVTLLYINQKIMENVEIKIYERKLVKAF